MKSCPLSSYRERSKNKQMGDCINNTHRHKCTNTHKTNIISLRLLNKAVGKLGIAPMGEIPIYGVPFDNTSLPYASYIYYPLPYPACSNSHIERVGTVSFTTGVAN